MVSAMEVADHPHDYADAIAPITYSQQARDQCTNTNLLTIPAADHGFIKSDFTTACNSAVTFIRNTMVLSWNALEGSWWFSNVCWSRPFRAS